MGSQNGLFERKTSFEEKYFILNIEGIFGINRAILISQEIVYARSSSIIQH